MRERAPDTVRLVAQCIAVHDDGWDMEQGALHIGHVYGDDVEIDGRYV